MIGQDYMLEIKLELIINILCPYLNYIDILILKETSISISRKISSRYLDTESIIRDKLIELGYSSKLYDILKRNNIYLGGEFILQCLYNKYKYINNLILVLIDISDDIISIRNII